MSSLYAIDKDTSIEVADFYFADGRLSDENRKKYFEQCINPNIIEKRRIDFQKEYTRFILKNDLTGKRIVLKGAGKHTEELLKLINDLNIIVEGIIARERFVDLKLLDDDMIRRINPDYIFISSYFYRFEMIEEVKRKYPNIPIYDLYEHGMEREFFT